MRILGKGITGKSIKNLYQNSSLYDEKNIDDFDVNSNELTVISPGISPFHYFVKNSKNIISEYDLLLNLDNTPLSIWISGTNGKSTTTKMAQKLLSKYNSSMGGNIGIPLASMNRKSDIWILETSSFTLHYTNKVSPNIYVLLPVNQDHISWHGSFEKYKKSKLKAMDNMSESEIAIIPKEFEYYPTMAKKIVYESSDDLCNIFSINKSKINFKEPFLLDAILSLCISSILFDEIDYKVINEYEIDEHTLEEVYDFKNRLWINDSKATNIISAIHVIKGFNNVRWILGGMLKEYNTVKFSFNFKHIMYYYILDKNYRKFLYFLLKNNANLSFHNNLFGFNKVCSTFFKGVIVFAPGSSSKDQWKNFKERGVFFKNLIIKNN